MSESRSVEGATIWAVDDEPDVLTSISGLLEDAGFEFRGFGSASDLLDAIAERQPDLFIIDLNMPHMSGTDLIRELRDCAETATIPVLVLTAMSSEGALLNAFEAGADDVLRKPFSLSELLARLTWQLSRSEQLTALRQQNRDLRLMTDVAKALNEEDQLPQLLRILIDTVRRALGVERCAVYLVDEGSGELHRALPAEPTKSEASPNAVLDLRDLPAAADSLAAREPAFLDAAGTEALLDAMGGVGPSLGQNCSSAIYPMVLRGKLVGVLVLCASKPNFGRYPRERFIASIVCDLAAVAVHRAELFQSIIKESEKIDAANRELAKTRDFLQNVIESSPDAIVASDRDGTIVLFNRAAESILGWDKAEAMGSDVRMLYPEGGAERLMHMLRSNNFGGRGRLEPKREIVVGADGEEIPVEISAGIVFEDGEVSATVGIFTDLRRRIQMEEKLQEATEHLERSRRQAVIAELAGAAAHELNQPLTSLLGYSELLRKRVDADDENRRAIETMHREAKRIADIVRKIGRITDYKTKEYVGGARIVDLDQASEVEFEDDSRETADLENSESEDTGDPTVETDREGLMEGLITSVNDESSAADE